MYANYHTHTWRCRHAIGTERQYIEQAIQSGMQVLGFSDHTPYPFPDGHDSGYRMFLHQTEDYFRTLTDLQKEYAGQIELHIGVEAEYYPICFEAMVELLRQYPCEYMLLGQHFLENEYDDPFYCGKRTDSPERLHRYCSQCIEALKTGKFLYFAHPDLLFFTGADAVYEKEMTRLCRFCREPRTASSAAGAPEFLPLKESDISPEILCRFFSFIFSDDFPDPSFRCRAEDTVGTIHIRILKILCGLL
jgi:histidinol-phosphatase (PHP family)